MKTIRQLRIETGLSQSQFAKKSGIPVRTLQEYEQGRVKPSAENYFKALEASNSSGEYEKIKMLESILDETNKKI